MYTKTLLFVAGIACAALSLERAQGQVSSCIGQNQGTAVS